MGTNYYSVKRDLDYENVESLWALERGDDVIHIGKSSAGWCFSLHIIPEMGINTLEDWIRMFIEPDRIIINEYRETVSFVDMMRIITARRGRDDPGRPPTPEFLEGNHAVPGPSGLVRHKIEPTMGGGCVGHGEGTYDYIDGEFS